MQKRTAKERRIICTIALLFLVFVVSALRGPSECYSKTETEIKCPQYWQEAAAGDTVSFDLSLKNPSYNYDSLLVYIDDPQIPESIDRSGKLDSSESCAGTIAFHRELFLSKG